MARRQTTFVPDHYYHLYNRGVNRDLIFREDANYVYLLGLIGEVLDSLDVSIIAYCLMPNHYHFLLRQDGGTSISTFMQRVFNAYTKAYNKRHHRSGTLFEGPFKSVHIDSDAYLIHLCRYIHRNPIDAGPPLVHRLEDWPFSNYPEWIGLRNGRLVDRAFVKEVLYGGIDYREFVMDALPAKVRQRMEKYLFSK